MSQSLASLLSRMPARSNYLWPKRCATCTNREDCPVQDLVVDNEILKEEIRVSRESAEITASLVVKQFEETERILQRLQVASAQRKAVLDSATHMAIVATDKEGRIIVFNKGAENLLGYSAKEVIGNATPLLFISPDELYQHALTLGAAAQHPADGIKLLFRHAMQSGQEQQEWTYQHKNGSTFPVTLSINPLRDPDGMVNGFLFTATDITEKKRSEMALRESERNYRSLFDSGPNPIFVLEPTDMRILDVNPAALDAYGYSRKAELIDRNFNELGEFEIPDAVLPPHSTINQADGCFINQKARHLKKDGSPFYIRVKACPIKYQERSALILAATDITEAIEKDAQLFQASKMTTLGEMSAGIAHELTQPLNAIKIGNDYLKRKIEKDQPLTATEVDRVATAITDQVQRASQIINRLREFGRKPDFKKEPVNINAIVTNVLNIIGQQLSLGNINVTYDLAEYLPAVLANPNRLEQVLFNLVTNARDAISQSGGRKDRNIVIETYLENDAVVCAVADTGGGIPDENRDKIFEPFFTTKEVGKGMGLGLAITYGIVRDYGGNITVKSKVGKGTRFEMRFNPGLTR